MSFFFTSDTHAYHKNILKFCPNTRKGRDHFEMTEHLIEAHNSVVSDDDVIFNLGDVSFGTEEQTIDYLSRLRGKKVLIYGNHDQVIQRSPRVQSMFDEIHTELTIWKGKTGIYMHHFAHRVWNKSHFGDIHLYGHSHNSLEHTPWGKSMDVGIDARPNGDMKPWTLDEIMDIMATRTIRPERAD